MTRSRRWLLFVGVAALALLAVAVAMHAALPGMLLDRYRASVKTMGEDYTGEAEGVEVFAWEGRYRLRDVRVTRRDGAIDAPLVQVQWVDVQMLPWRDEATVRVNGVRMHLVGGPGSSTQLGEGVPWRQLLDQLSPAARVQRVEFSDTAIRFHQARRPSLVITVDNLHGALDGLAGNEAELEAEGLLMAHAPLRVQAQFDPQGPIDALRLRARAHDVELAKLNEFTRTWANIDFHRGEAEMAIALDYAAPRVQGGAAVSLAGVDVFDLQQDAKRGLLTAVREMFAGAKVASMKEADGRIEREFAIDATVEPAEDNFDDLRAVLEAAFVDLGRHLPR